MFTIFALLIGQLMEDTEELGALAAIVYGNWDSEALKQARESED